MFYFLSSAKIRLAISPEEKTLLSIISLQTSPTKDKDSGNEVNIVVK